MKIASALQLLAILTLSALTACSDKNSNLDDPFDNNQKTTTQKYSYSFEYNGCSTGVQTFTSHSDYCNGLKSDSLNKNCAITLRYAHFRANCSTFNWQD